MAVDSVLASARQGNSQGLIWYASEHEIAHTFRAVDFLSSFSLPVYADRNTAGISGVFSTNDGLPNLRLTAPAGAAAASQAHRYYGGAFHAIFNKQTGAPVGMYYRAFVKIADLNRANIEFALCGFGRPDTFDNGFNARVRPVIGFFIQGSGNWLCRVEDGAGTVDQFDTGLSPTTPRLLEIVVQPGSVRFYVDGLLRRTSVLLFPALTVTDHQSLRYIGAHIKGDGSNPVSMDIAMERFHYYWLTSESDPVLSEARLNVFRPSYFFGAFWNGNLSGENPSAARIYRGRGGTLEGDFVLFNSSLVNKGLWTNNDQFWVGRCLAPIGQGNPDDAAAYLVLDTQQQDVRWGLYNRFDASPIGWYFGALAWIEDMNRASIDLAIVGFALRGNKGTDKEPIVGFVAEGAGNWKARVQDDASFGAVTDDFDTGISPVDPHYLEIVIIAGETRFYVDGSLVDTSVLEFPPDSAAKSDSWEREALFYIDGDNLNQTALRFGLVNVHTFERTTPVEY